MNNNKKILKRSSAAFLAVLNIFNFAGGSSKAHYIDCTPYYDYGISDCSVINSDIINNILKIADLKIARDSIKEMKINQETQAGLSLIQKIEPNNNGIYVCNLKLENEDFKLVYFDFKNVSIGEEEFNGYLEKVNEVYKSGENKKIGFVVFDKPGLWPIHVNAKHISVDMFYNALSKNKNIFVNKSVFSNRSSRDFIEEIKNLQEKLKTEQDKVQKANAEKENAVNAAKNELQTKINEANDAKDAAEAKVQGLETKNKELEGAKNKAEEKLTQAQKDLDTKLKTANSRAKKLGVVAVLGWVGTLVSLGCVFQNEFKNTCGTVYKKVLELKNSILG